MEKQMCKLYLFIVCLAKDLKHLCSAEVGKQLTRYNLFFTLTPMCVKHCILGTFPEFCDKNIHWQIPSVGFEPTTFALLEQLPLDPRASPRARGSSNPML